MDNIYAIKVGNKYVGRDSMYRHTIVYTDSISAALFTSYYSTIEGVFGLLDKDTQQKAEIILYNINPIKVCERR